MSEITAASKAEIRAWQPLKRAAHRLIAVLTSTLNHVPANSHKTWRNC
jgi:hypothetical protein